MYLKGLGKVIISFYIYIRWNSNVYALTWMDLGYVFAFNLVSKTGIIFIIKKTKSAQFKVWKWQQVNVM
jgi:hypothetical protein